MSEHPIPSENTDPYRRIIAAAMDGFWITDEAGRFLEVNDAYCALIGHERGEVLSMKLGDVDVSRSREEVALHIAQIIERGHDRFESTHRGKDGDLVELEISAKFAREEGQIIAFARDITSRKSVEDELRLSEERFRTFFEHAPIGKCMTTPDGRLQQVNPALCAMLGYDSAALANLSFAAITHPEDLPESRECVRSLLAGERDTYVMDKRYQTRDGQYLWTHVVTRILRDVRGEPLHFLTHIQDIDQLRRAEAQSRQSEQRYRTLAEAAPDMVFVVEADGTVSYLNSAAAAAFGTTPDRAANQRLDQLFPKEVARSQRQRIEQVLETGQSHNEVRLFPFGSRELYLDTSLVPLFDEEHQPHAVMGVARDVTEKKRLDEDLRAALVGLKQEMALTDAVFSSAPGVLYMLDFEGGFRRWNENMELITGRSHEEMATTNALELFDGEDQRVIAEGIRAVAEEGAAVVEARILHKNGGKIPHLFTGKKVEVEGEARLIGMGIDIGQRLEQELALRERMKELRCLFLASIAMNSEKSENELIEAVVALLPAGWQFPEVARVRIRLDGAWYGFEPAAPSADTLQRLTASILVSGEARGAVEVFYVEDRPAQDEGPFLKEERELIETIARLLGAAIDKRQTSAQFQRLVQRAPLPLCLVSGEEIVFPNERFIETFGYGREEVPTLAEWRRRAYPDENYRAWVLENWNAAVQKAADEGVDIEPKEYRVTCKDGRERFMEISGVVIGSSFLVTFVDQTEHRNAQEVLRQHRDELESLVRQRTQSLEQRTRELESSNRELEAFAYSVSHDLRAPLRSIAGFSHALMEDYHDKLDAEAQDYLERSAAAARRMGQLIDDSAMLSRITRSNMQPTKVDLSEMVREVAEELRGSQPSSEFELVIGEEISVEADPRLLRQVLLNLLENAQKFSARSPAPKVEVGVTTVDGERVLFVRDNGAGFDMAYADKLFSPFQRLHKETEFGGTGVGLSIVQRIVRRHGGRVWADSPGQGATFYFTLPERLGSWR